jgi:hypothetical protein
VAVTDLERIVCIVLVIIGATVYAYFMGNINVIVAALNASGTRKAKQLEAVDTFLKNHHVPSHIGDRVRNYYDYLWQREIHSNDKAIMGGLSVGLRSELVMYIYRSMLDKVSEALGPHVVGCTPVSSCCVRQRLAAYRRRMRTLHPWWCTVHCIR